MLSSSFIETDGNCKISILSSIISTIQFQGLPFGPSMGIPHQFLGQPQGFPQQAQSSLNGLAGQPQSHFQQGLAPHPPHGLLQYLQGFAHHPQGMPQQPEDSKDE